MPADVTHSNSDAVVRLREQFECGTPPHHHFRPAKVHDYPVFLRERLSEDLQKKLEKRKALGYEYPRAMTRDEISKWERARSAELSYEIDRTLQKPARSDSAPSSAEMRAQREAEKERERRRIAAETFRYGGPVRRPDTLAVKIGSTIAVIALGAAGISGVWLVGALFNALATGDWAGAVTPALVLPASLVIFMLGLALPIDISGDLNDDDLKAIDRAIEHVSLPPGDYKEYRLAEYTAQLAQRIADSPAWASDFLEAHRIELNYQQELRDITTHTHNLHAILCELGEPPQGDTPQVARAREHFERASAPLEVVWIALVERVAAFESFTLHLVELDTQLANMEAVGRATALEDKIGRLLTSAVSDEFAADHTRALTERSNDAVLSIDATLDALRGDIEGLTALSQSLPRSHATQ